MTSMNDVNRLIGAKEAAELLGLQPCTLAAWREDGSQPALCFFKIGRAVRYRYSDLLSFIETRKAASTLESRRLGTEHHSAFRRARRPFA